MSNVTITKESLMLATCTEKKRLSSLQGVCFNDRHVVATNGHFLAIKNRSFCEPKDLILNFEKVGTKENQQIELMKLGETPLLLSGNGSSAYPSEWDSKDFPDYTRALPSADNNTTFTVGLNAEYLLTLAKVVSASSKDRVVYLTFQKEETERAPIIVTGESDTVGVIMPCRGGDQALDKYNRVR